MTPKRPPNIVDPENKKTWTVGDVLVWTTDRFKESSMKSPRLEAEILLASVLKCDRVTIYMDYQKPLDEDERKRYRELVKKRISGQPTAYLVGHREFWSLDFEVNPDVLIPRPETELLVEIALELLKNLANPSIADIGTGSGCIAIALAKERKDARIVATDISSKALATAEANARRHGSRIEFVRGELIEPLRGKYTFDLVVSNPPYIALKNGPQAEPDVIKHEPYIALAGGDDGLAIIRPLVAGAPEIIRPEGRLIMETAMDQAVKVKTLMEETGKYEHVEIRQDLAGLDRAVYGRVKIPAQEQPKYTRAGRPGSHS